MGQSSARIPPLSSTSANPNGAALQVMPFSRKSSWVGFLPPEDAHGSFSPAPAACLLCPQFWKLLGDRCYELSTEKGNWTQAKMKCENLQSQLAVLRKKAEKVSIEQGAGRDLKMCGFGGFCGRKPLWSDWAAAGGSVVPNPNGAKASLERLGSGLCPLGLGVNTWQ